MEKEIEIVEPEAPPEMAEEEIVTIPRMTIPADARQLRDYGTMRDYLRIDGGDAGQAGRQVHEAADNRITSQ